MKSIYLFFLVILMFFSRAIKAQNGRILLEYWDEIKGNSISGMTGDVNYPNNPSGRMFPQLLEGAPNMGSNYGTLIRGYVKPPISGSYIFWIAGDDKCELFLSTDNSPSNKTKIAYSDQITGYREWNKYPTQQSIGIDLIAGNIYYIEITHKQSTGTDHVSVGWSLPDGTYERPIPGIRISPYEAKNSIPAPGLFLNTQALSHPYIQFSSRDCQKLKSIISIGSNPDILKLYKKISKTCNSILSEPTLAYTISGSDGLLEVSRGVLDRVINLGILYNIEPDSALARSYANRAWLELSSAALFPDWNPGHFLDAAEMTHAFALGYDWLYSYLSAAQKITLKNAILNYGFQPFKDAYNNADWWTTSIDNWNSVCNGGIAMGAIALGNDAAVESDEILALASNSLNNYSLNSFGPDGSWPEGPMYWGYALQYQMAFLSAIETAYGGDFGLGEKEGLSESGSYPIYLTGGVNQLFNFGDGGSTLNYVNEYSMFYVARKYQKPEYSWYQRDLVKGISPYNLIWFDTTGSNPQTTGYATDKSFTTRGVVSMRSEWGDTSATFLSAKASSNAAGHSDLDNGDFVFDALGYRWALDLGSENYNLPGIFSSDRWNYYRKRAEGQNTLVVNPYNGPDQDPNSSGAIISTDLNSQDPTIVTNIAAVYGSVANKMLRGFKLLDRKNLVVQDELQFATPSELWWFMHTSATIVLTQDNKSAILFQGTKRLFAKILAGPSDALFTIMDANPLPTSPNPAGQNPNSGILKLAIHSKSVTSTTLAVLFIPLNENDPIPDSYPDVVSLDGTEILANDPSRSVQIKIFPNPVKDELFYVIPDNAQAIEVRDLSSNVVYSKSITAEKSSSCNLSYLPQGIYIFSAILSDGSTLKSKICILR